MRTVYQYTLRQFLVPFAFFAAVLMAVVWLTQAFRMLDLILNRGQDAGTFGLFALLITPKVATIVIPIALLCAVLYCLNRLRNDSELVVLWSAGMDARSIAAPILMATWVITLIMFVVTLYLAPQGQRTLRGLIVEVREDLAGAVLQEATFNQPANGLTVYVRERAPGGELTGLLVHDNKNKDKPVTYMAERGLFLKTDASPRIVMQNGRIQTLDRKTGAFSTLSFDKYTFDLGQFVSEDVLVQYKPSERTLMELFKPDEFARTDREARKFQTELHMRLSGPLYGLAFVYLALALLLHAPHSRGNLMVPIAITVGISVAVRLGGFRLTNEVNRNPEMAIALYLMLAAAIAVPAWMLNRKPERARQAISVEGEAA
ncbi:MAG: LPS export ABC transporter permease LptF [Alphaproteobacteria bacterium]